MHCKKLKRNKGYVAADAVLGIGIFIVITTTGFFRIVGISRRLSGKSFGIHITKKCRGISNVFEIPE